MPKYWIEQHGLNAKDTVEIIIMKNGDLLIKPFAKRKQNDTATVA